MIEYSLNHAGFLKRLCAYVIDQIILVSLFIFIIPTLLFEQSKTDYIIMSYMLDLWIPALIYRVVLEYSALQATLGKYIPNLKVTTLEGEKITLVKSLIRNVIKIISGLILLGGFLMYFLNEKKQTLHDIFSNTIVVNNA